KALVGLAQTMSGERQRHYFDAFVFKGLDLVARSGAADVALGGFAIMDLAGLFREGSAHVVGVLNNVLHQPRKHFSPYIGVLLRAAGRRIAGRALLAA